MSVAQQNIAKKDLGGAPPDYSDFTQTFEGPTAAVPPAPE